MNFEFDSNKLFLVGIAASAGGVQAMQDLLASAACHGSMSFVVVAHVARYRETELASILQRASHITAKEVEDGMAIENCRLYTIPPNKYVEIETARFRLRPRPEGTPNEAANVFFQSLSVHYKENAVGVVLSGSAIGADGSDGVRAIKLHCGHTYAQLPETAEFPAMPTLAIETGCIDIVATPREIGHDLSLVAWAT